MAARLPTRFTRLHVQPVGGVAGDMLLAALIDVGADLSAIVAALHSLRVPGLELRVDRMEINSEPACYVRSLAPGDGHTRRLAEIHAVLDKGDVAEPARAQAKAIFDLMTAAEAEAHGATVGEVHLHEVGEIDSIMDVLGICVALHSLGDPEITSEPLPSGHGTVETAHGTLDCPVPAVRAVATRAKVPLVDVDVEGETVTPTGIAVLATVCHTFGEPPAAEEPAARIGVGAGTRRFESRSNVVRIHGWP